MKTKIKILLVALMAMMVSNVWADGTTLPAGTYIFDIRVDNCTGFELFGDRGHKTKLGTFNGSLDCNSTLSTSGDGKSSFYKSTGYISTILVSLESQIEASASSSFYQYQISKGSWYPSGWAKFGTHTVTEVATKDAKKVFLCIIKSDGTMEWSTDIDEAPDCVGLVSNPTLSYSETGEGKVSATAAGVAKASGSEVAANTAIVLTATPSSGVFVGWTDDNNSDAFVSLDNPLSIPMPAQNVSYTAHFEADRTIDGCADCFKLQK